ncbi:MAG TPA: ABC transporter substrate-binding protein [Acetobacteraceae bacterium]|nr:ABC transporter substrate-binding protein [Acetobacteraceae bacterium]
MALRRSVLAIIALGLALAPAAGFAQGSGESAAGFIQRMGQQLVSIIDGHGSTAEKQAALERIVDSDVDVSGIARFCLGRYWRVATPAQQQQYETLFRKVLMISIDGKLGDYQGVRFTVGRTVPRAEGQVVATTITAPNKPPTEIDWVVRNIDGSWKIVDVIAEGTSLRLTQRDDYDSFIAGHGQSVQALIDALRRQVSQNA